jgi:hypothetical protein
MGLTGRARLRCGAVAYASGVGDSGRMTEQLLVEVVESGADDERLSELTHNLRVDLLQLDVESVYALPEGTAPPGSRALELAAVGTLVVVVKGSVALAEQVVSTVRAWLHRTPEAERSDRSLKLTLNGQTLELSAATEGQQQQAVEEFLRVALADTHDGPATGAS